MLMVIIFMQTRQPVFVQLLQSAFRLSQCAWLSSVQRTNVDSCIRTLYDMGMISCHKESAFPNKSDETLFIFVLNPKIKSMRNESIRIRKNLNWIFQKLLESQKTEYNFWPNVSNPPPKKKEGNSFWFKTNDYLNQIIPNHWSIWNWIDLLLARSRSIAIPSDLDNAVSSLFHKPALVAKASKLFRANRMQQQLSRESSQSQVINVQLEMITRSVSVHNFAWYWLETSLAI